MKSNDIKSRDEIRALMQKAVRDNDTEGFYQAFDEMLECIRDDVIAQHESRFDELRQDFDSKILAARGARQLTSRERDY